MSVALTNQHHSPFRPAPRAQARSAQSWAKKARGVWQGPCHPQTPSKKRAFISTTRTRVPWGKCAATGMNSVLRSTATEL